MKILLITVRKVYEQTDSLQKIKIKLLTTQITNYKCWLKNHQHLKFEISQGLAKLQYFFAIRV